MERIVAAGARRVATQAVAAAAEAIRDRGDFALLAGRRGAD